MNLIRRCTAALLAAAMVLVCAGCTDSRTQQTLHGTLDAAQEHMQAHSAAKPQTDAPAPSARRLLIPMVLAGGLADTMSKIFEANCDPAHEEAFILMTFATAFAICLVMFLRAHERPAPVDIACGIMLGTFNFFSTDLMLRALMELPAYLVYTGFSMGVVLLTYAANALVMHEKLSKRDNIAIALVIIALALINLPR